MAQPTNPFRPLKKPKVQILVLGAGNFGSCLADHLGDSEHSIFLWSRDRAQIEYFNLHRRNKDYLKDHLFSENITAVGPALPDGAFVKEVDVLLFAIPTQGLRSVALGCGILFF
jgi:glycerol-3-phosphate dehydrogenase